MNYLPLKESIFIQQYRQVKARKENKEFMLKFGKILWRMFYWLCIYVAITVSIACFNHGISII